MNTEERETILDLIDLTLANTQLISGLHRQVSALAKAVRELRPAVDRNITEFAESAEKVETTHESLLEAAQKLAAGKGLLRSSDTSAALGETIRELAEDR